MGYRKQAGVNEDLFRQQSNNEAALKPLLLSKIVQGFLVENIELSTTAKLVEHKLNRKPIGYIICKSNAPANIYSVNAQFDSKLFENLAASTACIVSIWFF